MPKKRASMYITPAEVRRVTKKVPVKPWNEENLDYDPDLYEWQDKNVEVLPKWTENRDLGYALEAAGDIFRELTGRKYPDGGYIGEKTGRLERLFQNPVDVEELQKPLSAKDQERMDKLKERWSSLHGLSVRLKAARDLNIALADQNVLGAKFNLKRFKEEWGREPNPMRHPRRSGWVTERIGPRTMVTRYVRRSYRRRA